MGKVLQKGDSLKDRRVSYGDRRRFYHDDEIQSPEEHREEGRMWDDKSRMALRTAGLHTVCFSHHLKSFCRNGDWCKCSHETLSAERLKQLSDIVQQAHHLKHVQDMGREVPKQKPQATDSTVSVGGTASASSSGPSSDNPAMVYSGDQSASSSGPVSANLATGKPADQRGTTGVGDDTSGDDAQLDTISGVQSAVPVQDLREPFRDWIAKGPLRAVTPMLLNIMCRTCGRPHSVCVCGRSGGTWVG